jgi:hypothetical protein
LVTALQQGRKSANIHGISGSGNPDYLYFQWLARTVKPMSSENDQSGGVSTSTVKPPPVIVGRVQNSLLTGLKVTAPFVLTIGAIGLMFVVVWYVDDLTHRVLHKYRYDEAYLHFWLLDGSIIVLLSLALLGYLYRNRVGRKLVDKLIGFSESIVSCVPYVRDLYRTNKQNVQTLFPDSALSLRRVDLSNQGGTERRDVVSAEMPGQRGSEAADWTDRVFISYARSDRKALTLGRDLRNSGVNIWIDQLDIAPGRQWDREIQAALQACSTVIVVLTPNSVSSDNVLNEIDYAIGQRKEIVPALMEPCEVPLLIRRLQYVDFTRDYQSGLEQCTKRLRG